MLKALQCRSATILALSLVLGDIRFAVGSYYSDLSRAQRCTSKDDCDYAGCSDSSFWLCDVYDSSTSGVAVDRALHACVRGAEDHRCQGKPYGFDLEDGGWCWGGRRDTFCPKKNNPMAPWWTDTNTVAAVPTPSPAPSYQTAQLQRCAARQDCNYEGCTGARNNFCGVIWCNGNTPIGVCIRGSDDGRCRRKANGFDLMDGGWCWNGMRETFCPRRVLRRESVITVAPMITESTATPRPSPQPRQTVASVQSSPRSSAPSTFPTRLPASPTTKAPTSSTTSMAATISAAPQQTGMVNIVLLFLILTAVLGACLIGFAMVGIMLIRWRYPKHRVAPEIDVEDCCKVVKIDAKHVAKPDKLSLPKGAYVSSAPSEASTRCPSEASLSRSPSVILETASSASAMSTTCSAYSGTLALQSPIGERGTSRKPSEASLSRSPSVISGTSHAITVAAVSSHVGRRSTPSAGTGSVKRHNSMPAGNLRVAGISTEHQSRPPINSLNLVASSHANARVSELIEGHRTSKSTMQKQYVATPSAHRSSLRQSGTIMSVDVPHNRTVSTPPPRPSQHNERVSASSRRGHLHAVG